MIEEINHWESLTPIKLASKLKQKAFMKQSLDEIDQTIINYFSNYHRKNQNYLSTQIGDELSLISYIAEIFSNDPIYQLLHCGLVVFNDSICVNIQRISYFLSTTVNDVIEALRKANYINLLSLPPNCFEALLQLGFIDSIDFLMLTVSPADPFFFHIGSHPMIVQPFPLELIDLLLFAKQTSMQIQKKKLANYIESAKRRINRLNINSGNSSRNETDSNINGHSVAEEEEIEEEDM